MINASNDTCKHCAAPSGSEHFNDCDLVRAFEAIVSDFIDRVEKKVSAWDRKESSISFGTLRDVFFEMFGQEVVGFRQTQKTTNKLSGLSETPDSIRTPLVCTKCSRVASEFDEEGDFCDASIGESPADRCNGCFEVAK